MDPALRYRFFRTSWPGGALLVDVIRRRGVPETRVSYVSGSGTGVVRAPGPRVLDADGSAGRVGPVRWDLAYTMGPAVVSAPPAWFPAPHAVDLALVSRPDLTVSGTVTIDGDTVTLADRPGMACGYSGRRLPDRWLWVSANDFDLPGVAVELGLVTSRLWGVPAPLPRLGYAWLRTGGGERYVASPLNGLVRRVPNDNGLRLVVTGGWQVRIGAPETSFVDLGEGIFQTLTADCVLTTGTDRYVARGNAVLEVRRGLRR